MTKAANFTLKELEQKILQCIQKLYVDLLGHQPQQVSCQLVDKTLTVLIEDSITQPEQILVNSGKQDLVKQVRSNIHVAVESRLRANIEEIVGVAVTDLFADSTLDTRRTSIVAILATAPHTVESN
ncbi:DUF2294 domain-containing protein [Aliterella atlantica]|uniref:Na+-translocating membrane potential-generating system MpsC domain-containing protein n=1 Tax=Aliterella atlantica CENA595 TaxID=1618023 RepID=A0A0D8ZQP1_9CYAN|nr:DUF2294 domain-containing protein [Aliterella atlantica]KJH71128.1 hypothetical protein UH38_14025 [Aliterella atlantica CENA595]